MQLTIYHPGTSAVWADALFASVLQRSDNPSAGQVRKAIAAKRTMASAMAGVIEFFITRFLSYGLRSPAVLPCRLDRSPRHLRRCGQRRRATSA